MKHRYAHWLLGLMFSCLASSSLAAEYQTLAIVTGSSVEAFSADLSFLGKTVQNARMAENAGKALSKLSGVTGLDGLDRTRRWAVALRTDGIDIAPLVLVPVADLPLSLQSLRPILGQAEKTEDGLFKIGSGSFTGYIREHDGWAYLAQSPDRLADLPNPQALLAEADDDALLAITIFIRRLPEAYRGMAIDRLREMTAAAISPPPSAGLSSLLSQEQSLALLQMVEEGLTSAGETRLAVRIDHLQKTLHIDLRVTPLEGTPLNAAVGQLAEVSDKAAELPRDEACRLHVNWPMDDAGRAVWRGRLDRYRQASGPPPDAGAKPSLGAWFAELAAETVAADNCRLELVAVGERPPVSLAARFDLRDKASVARVAASWNELRKQQPPAPAAANRELEIPPWPGAVSLRVDTAALPPALARDLGEGKAIWLAADEGRVVIGWGPRADLAFQRAFAAADDKPRLELSLHAGTSLSQWSQWIGSEQLKSLAPLLVLNLRSADDRVFIVAGRDQQDLRLSLTAHEGILRTAAFGLSLGVLQVMSGN
ncbi:MAG: hypothetical protein AB7O62_21600 [Pirellulales bacterium]